MTDKSVVYVFYQFELKQQIRSWDYKDLPHGWYYSRHGYIPNTLKVSHMFEETNPKAINRRYEVQFYGGLKNKREMMSWLHELFSDLKDQGILTDFMIRDFY